MFSVIETPTYLRSIAVFWGDEDAAAFVDFIAANPQAGDAYTKAKFDNLPAEFLARLKDLYDV